MPTPTITHPRSNGTMNDVAPTRKTSAAKHHPTVQMTVERFTDQR
jgi:hypothetical protein